MKFVAKLIIILVLFLISGQAVEAANGINRKINFQGKVVNKGVGATDGTNVADGSYDFKFTLWDSLSAGTSLWTEVWNSGSAQVSVSSGIFNVALGTYSTFPSTVNFNSDSLFLSVNYRNDGDMSPRIQMTAVPYAFNAEKVMGLTVTATTGTLSIGNSKTITFGDDFTTTGVGITLNQSLATTNNVTFAGLSIGGSASVTGNLSVGGSVAFTNIPVSVGTTVLFIDGAGKLTQGFMSSGVGTTYAALNGLSMVATNTFGLGGTLTQNTRLNIGNTEVMYFQYPTGNIGIGTTSPTHKLDLIGNSADYLSYVYNSDTSPSSGGLYLRTDGTGNILTINNNGSDIVTISAAQTTFNNPVNFSSSGDITIAHNLNFTNATGSYIKSNAPLYLQAGESFNSSDLTFRTFNYGNLVFDTAGVTLNQPQTWTLATGSSQALNISSGLMSFDTSNNRVGIGTSNPTNTLDILGTLKSSGATTLGSNFNIASDGNSFSMGSYGGIQGWYNAAQFFAGDSKNAFIFMKKGNTTAYTDVTATNPTVRIQSNNATIAEYLSLYHNGSNGFIETGIGNLILSPVGNVGIGTTNPTKKLDVVGDINLTGTIFSSGASGSNGQILSSTGTGLSWINSTSVGTTYTTSNGLSMVATNTFGLGGTLSQNTSLDLSSYGLSFLGLGGTQSLFISSTGNVGIGTTNPLAQLSIITNIGSEGLRVFGTTQPITTNVTAAHAPAILTVTGAAGQSTSASSGVAGNGSNIALNAGAGGDATNNVLFSVINAGSGGNISFASGNGGIANQVNTAGRGGNSGLISLTTGSGGAGEMFGGNAGNIQLTTGNGGSALGLDNPSSAGNGGNFILSAGQGGTINNNGTNRTAGSGGNLFLFGGIAGTGGSIAGKVGNVYLAVGTSGISQGNVGIGMTNPSKILDIAGDINLTGTIFSAGTSGSSGQILSSTGTGLSWINSASVGTTYTTSNGLSMVATNTFGLGGTLTQNTRLNIGNTEVLYFQQSTGNVGIGTTSPGYKFDVNGNSNITGNLNLWNLYAGSIYSPILGGNGMYAQSTKIYTTTGQDIVFGSQGGASLYMTIKDGGNVGIGTTAPSNLLDVNGLFVVDNVNSKVGVGSTNISGYSQKFVVNGTAWITGSLGVGSLVSSGAVTINGYGTVIQPASNNVALIVKASASETNNLQQWQNSSGTVLNVVDISGNVGIGTTDPTKKLDIVGDLKLSGTMFVGAGVTGTNGQVLASNGAGSLSWITPSGATYYANNGLTMTGTTVSLGGTLTANTQIGTSSFGLSFLGLGGTRSLFVSSNGNIGMGTTNPTGKLNILGTEQATETNISQITANNSLVITGTYGAGDNYFPGIAWNMSDNNFTKSNAGIYSQFTGSGSKLIFGISDSYATGITRSFSFVSGGYASLGLLTAPNISATGNLDVTNNVVIGGTTATGSLNLNKTTGVGGSYVAAFIGTGTTGFLGYLDTSGWDKSTSDDYSYWVAKVGNTVSNISAGNTLTFTAGTGIGMTFAGGVITINSTGGIGTTYAANNGLSMVATNTMGLGGTLSQNTKLNLSSYGLSFLGLGGTQSLFVGSNGNVGIGTTNPGTVLHVVSSAQYPAIQLESRYNGDTMAKVNFLKSRNGGPVNNWDTIGGYYWDALNSSSQVKTFASLYTYAASAANGSEDGAMEFHVMSGGTDMSVMGLGPDNITFNESLYERDFRAFGSASDKVIFFQGWSGNFGIGTSNPAKKLDVVGDIKLTGTLFVGAGVTGTSGQVLASNGAGSLQWVTAGGVGTTYAANNGLSMVATNTVGLGGTLSQNTKINISSYSLSFLGLGNTQALFVGATGYVGVGTTNPLYSLHVVGNSMIGTKLGVGATGTRSFNVSTDASIGTNLSIGGSLTLTALPVGIGTSIIYIDGNGNLTSGTMPGFANSKSIVLSPEFSGASLSADGSGTTAVSMTSDNTLNAGSGGWKNYYQLSSSQAALQDYSVLVRVTLPSDFNTWETGACPGTTCALEMNYQTGVGTTGDNYLSFVVSNDADTPGTAVCSIGQTAATAWQKSGCAESVLNDNSAPEWDAAGETAVIRIKMGAKNTASALSRMGDIVLRYKSKF